VLEVFLPAARGLAAAHAAGLIHRDFKPDNVLVGADGRVRVTDFGLASALVASAPAAGADRSTFATPPATTTSGATTTAIGGSPPYMAPEQLRGEAVDARADVFSYSVALHEALYGARPFAGESLGQLEDAIRRGRLEGARRGRRVPAWLRRALARGLRHDRAERFPSMGAMIAALEKGRRAAARRSAAAVVLALAALAALIFARTGQPRPPPAPAAGVQSLAVLPFQDLSGGRGSPPADDAEIWTEAMTTDLARTRGLRVTSRRAADAFRHTSRTAADLGRELNVEALLEGDLSRAGGRIRVDLRMVTSSGGRPIWSTRLEGAARDGFALEIEAARAVRAALGRATGSDDLARPPPTRSADASDLYYRGRIHLMRENERDNAEAIRLLQGAVAADPRFAAAQAELAHACGLRVAQFAPGDGAALECAEAAAHAAVGLDPDLAEAHYVTGYLLWGVLPERFWHERAVRELERALALNPNLADAHHELGMIYVHVGLFERAIAELQRTLVIDPTDSNARRRIALARAYLGDYAESLRMLREVPQQAGPALWGFGIGFTLQHLGRSREALALAQEYLRANPEDRGGVVTSTRALLFAEAGDARRALADVQTAIEKGKGFVHFHHAAYNIASAYALLGSPEEAVRWLRRAADDGFPCYPLFATDPNLASLRHDPGYVALMAELKTRWERYRDL
jgi:TolB-like protein/tetratricopeptide (TPR) repeat protein